MINTDMPAGARKQILMILGELGSATSQDIANNSDGRLSSASTYKYIGELLDAEFVEVVKLMPQMGKFGPPARVFALSGLGQIAHQVFQEYAEKRLEYVRARFQSSARCSN